MSDNVGKIVIPKISIKRCYLCKNLLTVPPIRSVCLESEDYRCGRCVNVKITTYSRNMLYENVAKFQLFPCTYEGCKKEIPWSQALAHERECPFRTIQCPAYYLQCDEVIQVEKIREHFQKKHPQNIKRCDETWTLSNIVDHVYLMHVEGLDFLVYILHANGRHAINVFATRPLTKFTMYNVRVVTGDETGFSIMYENRNICCYDERQHCYKCIDGQCEAKHHPFASRLSDMSFDDFTDLKNHLTDGVTGNMKYMLNLPRKDAQPPQHEGTKGSDETSDVLANQMKCPICHNYLIAPIFVCKVGHTVCNLCRPRLKNCHTCNAELGDSRNYHLEEITELINLPCHYKSKGCTYAGNTEKIVRHERECNFMT